MSTGPMAQRNEPRNPQPGESFDGYLAFRAAHALLPGPFAIAACGGATYAQHPQLAFGDGSVDDGLADVAEELGITVDELRVRSHPKVGGGRRRFHSTSIDTKLIEKRSRRFSPTSLISSPHHRALWSIRCLPFCEESWETLADVCPKTYCGAIQRWRRSSGVDRCDQCGSPLTTAAVHAVPVCDRSPLALLCGLLHHDPERVQASVEQLPPAMAELPPGGLVEIASALAGLHDPGIRSHYVRHIRGDTHPLRIASAMAEAGRLLRDWPRSGERLAAGRLAKRTGKFGDGNGGATIDFLALAGTGNEPVGRAAAMLATALRSNASAGLPIKEAVVGSGLRVSQMADERRAGRVDTIFHLAGDRIVPLISTSSLRCLRERRGQGIPVRNLAKRLGIPANGVEQLLLLGILSPATAEEAATYGPRSRVDTGSIDRLLSRLVEVGTNGCDASWISLLQASRRSGGDLKPWGIWFERILDGSIKIAIADGDPPDTSRILMSRHSAQVMGAARLDYGRLPSAFHPLMSKADAGATLNLHSRYTREAFQEWPTPNDLGPCIPLDDVRRLAAHHVATPELGALLGVSSMEAARRANDAGLSLTSRGYDWHAVAEAFALIGCRSKNSVDPRSPREA